MYVDKALPGSKKGKVKKNEKKTEEKKEEIWKELKPLVYYSSVKTRSLVKQIEAESAKNAA